MTGELMNRSRGRKTGFVNSHTESGRSNERFMRIESPDGVEDDRSEMFDVPDLSKFLHVSLCHPNKKDKKVENPRSVSIEVISPEGDVYLKPLEIDVRASKEDGIAMFNSSSGFSLIVLDPKAGNWTIKLSTLGGEPYQCEALALPDFDFFDGDFDDFDNFEKSEAAISLRSFIDKIPPSAFSSSDAWNGCSICRWSVNGIILAAGLALLILLWGPLMTVSFGVMFVVIGLLFLAGFSLSILALKEMVFNVSYETRGASEELLAYSLSARICTYFNYCTVDDEIESLEDPATKSPLIC